MICGLSIHKNMLKQYIFLQQTTRLCAPFYRKHEAAAEPSYQNIPTKFSLIIFNTRKWKRISIKFWVKIHPRPIALK